MGGDIADYGLPAVRQGDGFDFADVHFPGKDAPSMAIKAEGLPEPDFFFGRW